MNSAMNMAATLAARESHGVLWRAEKYLFFDGHVKTAQNLSNKNERIFSVFESHQQTVAFLFYFSADVSIFPAFLLVESYIGKFVLSQKFHSTEFLQNFF